MSDKMKKTYYEFLKDEIENARFESEDLDRTILFIPDLFNLLCAMLDEDMLSQEDRLISCGSLGYLVAPSDMIPEEVYGSKGFMDDLFILTVVLRDLFQKFPDVIKRHWYNSVDDRPFEEVLELCYIKSSNILEEENLKEKTLRYSGLKS